MKRSRFNSDSDRAPTFQGGYISPELIKARQSLSRYPEEARDLLIYSDDYKIDEAINTTRDWLVGGNKDVKAIAEFHRSSAEHFYKHGDLLITRLRAYREYVMSDLFALYAAQARGQEIDSGLLHFNLTNARNGLLDLIRDTLRQTSDNPYNYDPRKSISIPDAIGFGDEVAVLIGLLHEKFTDSGGFLALPSSPHQEHPDIRLDLSCDIVLYELNNPQNQVLVEVKASKRADELAWRRRKRYSHHVKTIIGTEIQHAIKDPFERDEALCTYISRARTTTTSAVLERLSAALDEKLEYHIWQNSTTSTF